MLDHHLEGRYCAFKILRVSRAPDGFKDTGRQARIGRFIAATSPG
jgi:hypothetical protein